MNTISTTTASSSFTSSTNSLSKKCTLCSSDFLGSISFPNSYKNRFPRCFISSSNSSNSSNRRNYRFLCVPRADAQDTSKNESESENVQNNVDNEGSLGNNDDDEGVQLMQKKAMTPSPVSIRLDDVNPVGLGRKSRQLFDEVWRKFSGLGQISRTIRSDDEEALEALLSREGPMCEFAIPGAQNTVVLVVGATSRIGRIVVRKLMLRGYTVKVPFLPFPMASCF